MTKCRIENEGEFVRHQYRLGIQRRKKLLNIYEMFRRVLKSSNSRLYWIRSRGVRTVAGINQERQKNKSARGKSLDSRGTGHLSSVQIDLMVDTRPTGFPLEALAVVGRNLFDGGGFDQETRVGHHYIYPEPKNPVPTIPLSPVAISAKEPSQPNHPDYLHQRTSPSPRHPLSKPAQSFTSGFFSPVQTSHPNRTFSAPTASLSGRRQARRESLGFSQRHAGGERGSGRNASSVANSAGQISPALVLEIHEKRKAASMKSSSRTHQRPGFRALGRQIWTKPGQVGARIVETNHGLKEAHARLWLTYPPAGPCQDCESTGDSTTTTGSRSGLNTYFEERREQDLQPRHKTGSSGPSESMFGAGHHGDSGRGIGVGMIPMDKIRSGRPDTQVNGSRCPRKSRTIFVIQDTPGTYITFDISGSRVIFFIHPTQRHILHHLKLTLVARSVSTSLFHGLLSAEGLRVLIQRRKGRWSEFHQGCLSSLSWSSLGGIAQLKIISRVRLKRCVACSLLIASQALRSR
jgi:hypothetical protein